MASNSQMGDGGKKDKTYFSWTSEMDLVMSACFIDQINQGNRSTGKCAWKAKAWTAVIKTLSNKLGVNVTKGNVQARLKTWEKHHEIVSSMLRTSGFSWNYGKGRVEVGEERVWNNYVKDHPGAIPYRKRIIIDNWDDICTLFGHTTGDGAQSQDYANGEDDQTSLEAEVEILRNDESDYLENTVGTNDGEERGLEDETTNPSGEQSREGKFVVTSSLPIPRSRKRKERGTRSLHGVLTRIADSLDLFLNSEPPKATAQMVLDELSKVGDLDQTTYLKAVDLLMKDQRRFDAFAGLPDELKKQYILLLL